MAELALRVAENPESNDIRVGRVETVTPTLTVSIQGRVIQGGVLGSPLVAVGDPVAVTRQGATWLVLGRINDLSSSAAAAVIGWGATTTTSAFTGAVEIEAVRTAAAVRFAAGHAAKIEFEADFEGGVASNMVDVKFRRASLSGTIVRNGAGLTNASAAGFGTTCRVTAIVANRTAADIVDVIVVGFQCLIAGTARMVAAANRLGYVRVTDLGSEKLYPVATALT